MFRDGIRCGISSSGVHCRRGDGQLTGNTAAALLASAALLVVILGTTGESVLTGNRRGGVVNADRGGVVNAGRGGGTSAGTSGRRGRRATEVHAALGTLPRRLCRG